VHIGSSQRPPSAGEGGRYAADPGEEKDEADKLPLVVCEAKE